MRIVYLMERHAKDPPATAPWRVRAARGLSRLFAIVALLSWGLVPAMPVAALLLWVFGLV